MRAVLVVAVRGKTSALGLGPVSNRACVIYQGPTGTADLEMGATSTHVLFGQDPADNSSMSQATRTSLHSYVLPSRAFCGQGVQLNSS